MIRDLKPYPKYDDTGIEWLSKKPEQWKLLPGRACYREKKIPNIGLKESTVLSLSYGRIVVKPPEKLHGLVPESFETYQIVEPGNIICRPTDLQNDKVSLRFGISTDDGIITSAYMCFTTIDPMEREFGHLLFHSYDLKKIFYGLGSGLRQNLSWDDFKYLPCLVPPPEEQEVIVRFLDYANQRIRQYIRNKQKLIKLLEEQKQAAIHQAVTRGLDPIVPLKDSGVDWLGEIPAHWEVRRLRNLVEMRVSNVDKHIKEGEHPVRLCNYVDVYKNDEISDAIEFMEATATVDEITRFRLEKEDVIITKDSETWDDIGVPALVNYTAPDLICGYHLALLRPNKDYLNSSFLFRALQSVGIQYQFHVSAKGVTRYGLSHEVIKSIWIPIPPDPEQVLISNHVTQVTKNLNQAISKAKQEIELLPEYHKSLVADVVTGKLDVRKTIFSLPKILESDYSFDDENENDTSFEDIIEEVEEE